ncbi:MAG: aminotransferase class V-fold PLP-dependent enzyme, partial [Clostridia bacterium]|nr:aminotransferase class V-fold PLP-dependent enzyme [Clostridia bacterium]
TLNGHGIAGLCAAAEYLEEVGIDAIHEKETALMRRLYEGIKDIECVTVYGDMDAEFRTAIVTMNLRDYDSSEVSDELSEVYGIATRPGAHCAPRMHMALGTEDRGAVRFSFSWFNTEEEVDQAIRAVQEMAE